MNSPTQKRKKIVKQAIANERLEGLKVSKESQKIASSYIVGKASSGKNTGSIRPFVDPYIDEHTGLLQVIDNVR